MVRRAGQLAGWLARKASRNDSEACRAVSVEQLAQRVEAGTQTRVPRVTDDRLSRMRVAEFLFLSRCKQVAVVYRQFFSGIQVTRGEDEAEQPQATWFEAVVDVALVGPKGVAVLEPAHRCVQLRRAFRIGQDFGERPGAIDRIGRNGDSSMPQRLFQEQAFARAGNGGRGDAVTGQDHGGGAGGGGAPV